MSKPLTSPSLDLVPTGVLAHLRVSNIKRSTNNPRHLFDRPQLDTLKRNIQKHGVLVPLTVFRPKGQEKYSILDGERRFRCAIELEEEGLEVSLPANVVQPPDPISGLLYMFSIHNFREQWELMPTALGLQEVIERLGVSDSKELNRLTGLSDPQIERCKILLGFPERFQKMSLDPDPQTRIPSNFWIEAHPVIELCMTDLPTLRLRGRDFITERLVQKYRIRAITGVTHFRRVMEAYEIHKDDSEHAVVVDTLQRFVLNDRVETRSAFDGFIKDNRRIQQVARACEEFIGVLGKANIEFVGDEQDRESIRLSLQHVHQYVGKLLEAIKGGEPPAENSIGSSI